MTEIKQAALCICILGAATGLLRMLIPSEKYKTRITFLIACIFSLCLINAILQRSVTEISEISNFSGLLMLSHSIPVTFFITLSGDSASLSMLCGVIPASERLFSSSGGISALYPSIITLSSA